MNDSLDQKIQILINLQARWLTRDLDSQKDKVSFLADCGLANQEIANIIGTSVGYVSVAKARLKKERGKDVADEE